jgi:hypothetical protein
MIQFFREVSELAMGLRFRVEEIDSVQSRFYKTSLHEMFGYELFTENEAVNRKKFMNLMIIFKGSARAAFLPHIVGAPLVSTRVYRSVHSHWFSPGEMLFSHPHPVPFPIASQSTTFISS